MQHSTSIDYQLPDAQQTTIAVPLRLPSYMVRHEVHKIILEYRKDYRALAASHEQAVSQYQAQLAAADKADISAINESISNAEVAYGDALVERMRRYEWSCFDVIVDYMAMNSEGAALVRSEEWRQCCDFDAITQVLADFRSKLRC